MISILSLVTSVKDYVEIVHKLIESDSNYTIQSYDELGPLITYLLLSIKNFLFDMVSLSWLKNIWNLPIIIPDISSSMISEISVLDGYFHNAFNFLDTPLSYGDKNGLVSSLEKLSIGVINSLFIWLPTSTAHIITLRRFVMQGLEAGYIAGLGTITGSILWIACIIFGCRFFVIPWISMDILRYVLGFILLVKYMWDSYNERRIVLEDLSKQKIFLLNFLLALTEQTSIYPFISNLSVGSESSIIESFPADNYWQFVSIHGCYVAGLTLGSLSLLHFTCWFLENPAFKIYMWVISSFKVSTSFYYKILNFTFLYLTMICAISSIPYYGLDYTLTSPLGLVSDDRIIDQKLVLETSFLNTKASDRNTRRNRGRHGRRERWKRRVRKYRTFDASLYDQGIYDLFTIEDLNYGFDRFWLRRKMRNHRVRFRFFPGAWMRSFKKQLAKPRLESYSGPRQEFFRILFEQVYHPSFHEYKKIKNLDKPNIIREAVNSSTQSNSQLQKQLNIGVAIGSNNNSALLKEKLVRLENTLQNNLIHENSMLRKFVRKTNTRIKNSEISSRMTQQNVVPSLGLQKLSFSASQSNLIYSKRWKEIFSKMAHENEQANTNNRELKGFLKNFYQSSLTQTNKKSNINYPNEDLNDTQIFPSNINFIKKENSKQNISKKDNQILRYRSMLITKNNETTSTKLNNFNSQVLFHPIKFYLQKQQAFERKLRYYTPTVFRKFSIENNAPYFRVMMKRYFYYYKPNLRWERTLKTASLRKARRKGTRTPRKVQMSETQLLKSQKERILTNNSSNFMKKNGAAAQQSLYKGLTFSNRLQKPTHNYSVVGKRASRYRYQIYKDVLQHWYYSPFNRLLLKFDIDSFIKRQPNSHFLTKKEENLLHLRRFLLCEHYNTLRWYTYMQHYRSMKTKIGGTKSFASRAYNQQFQGTFKKIRHLFAITPSQIICNKENSCKDQTILKFDQPLYNESLNSTKNPLQNNLILHEELLGDQGYSSSNINQLIPLAERVSREAGNQDLLSQSTKVIREYLEKSNPIKQEYIKKLIHNKNYSELTKFIYKGNKTRGNNSVTNQSLFVSQEKDYLLTNQEKLELSSLAKTRLTKFLKEKNLQQDLWINLLKKWKRKINDQEFLKNYLLGRIEKRERRKQKKEKNLKNKLTKLETWLKEKSKVNETNQIENTEKEISNTNSSLLKLELNRENNSINTGVKKAIVEGISKVNNLDLKTMNQQEKLGWKLNLKNHNLTFSSQLKTEKDIHSSLNSLSSIIKKLKVSPNNNFYKVNKIALKKNSLVKIKSIYKNYKTKLSNFVGINKMARFFKPKIFVAQKSLKNWRKKERALNKQKRSRKEFKALSKKPFKKSVDSTLFNDDFAKLNLSTNSLSLPLRKKRDFESKSFKTILQNSKFSNKENVFHNNEVEANIKSAKKTNAVSLERYSKFLTKQFKRKRSPHRRSRTRRNRGVTKKRTLSDSLKREFKNLRKYGEKLDNESKKLKIYQKINNNLSALDEQPQSDLNKFFSPKTPKQRRSKQKKQRSWKQKRSKYSQKLRKYRKRRRYVLGKIRVLNKQLKRIKSKVQIQNWWWKQFLPSLQATTDSLWQIEKDRQIQEKLSELSHTKVEQSLEQNFKHNLSNNGFLSPVEAEKMLQIGDHDFKPLSMPETIRIRDSFINKKSQLESFNKEKNLESTNSFNLTNTSPTNNESLIGQLSENLLISTPQLNKLNTEGSKFMVNTNTLPFYAGWDESLRKFVVTNRLLSRRDSGYQMNLSYNNISRLSPLQFSESNANQETSSSPLQKQQNNEILSFTSAPLKGMNAATTLYWQIPFTTYDPDQFFALGMDGFAPLGWRRFQFRHTILKTWLYQSQSSLEKQSKPIIIKKKTTLGNSNINIVNNFNKEKNYFKGEKKAERLEAFKEISKDFLYKIKEKNYSSLDNQTSIEYRSSDGIFNLQNTKNTYRRLKKRYRRVKKHPRSPVWFPSGPLLNQVLPVHYIYVFYKRSRLPRDRYLKRRLRSTNQITNKASNIPLNLIGQSPNKTSGFDFTLRKRVKTKRKYHRKSDLNKKTPILPRRLKFIGEDINSLRWRPLSIRTLSLNANKQGNKTMEELIKEQLNASRLKNKQLSSSRSKEKQPANLLRIRQLRRRVQRQIIRSVWRYRPRAGGFVWPGDYLRIELVKAPKLQTKGTIKPAINQAVNTEVSQARKIKRKKKRNISEWQIQPKKYLLQKHNIKVIKKKLEKAQRSNKIKQKIKELSLII
jgi:hypothetical protein